MADENVQGSQGDAGEPRPTVVTAFGVLHIVFGAFSIIGAIIAIGGSAVGSAIGGSMGVRGGAFAVITIFAVLALIVAVILLIAGILLLGRKKAGLTLSLVYVIASIAVRIINIIVSMIVIGGGIGWSFTVIGIAYPIVVLIVLILNKNVKAYFGKA